MKRKLRTKQLQETLRAEFFSDAVFAVAITLLALDLLQIHADPEAGLPTLFDALGRFWPVIFAFAASFGFIAVTWLNHHNLFARVARLSPALNAANLLLLAGIILVPWVTATLAEALSQGGGHGEQEVLLYGAVLAFNAVAWFILLSILAKHPDLLYEPEEASGFQTDRFSALMGIGVGAVGAFIGYVWSPIAATALFFAMPIFYAIVSPGWESVDDIEGAAP